MLCELRVSQLGVIEELSLVFGRGMTALTGETGAGKTLLVEAVELLLGGRADPVLVRPGATEAVVEGRFTVRGDCLSPGHGPEGASATSGDASETARRPPHDGTPPEAGAIASEESTRTGSCTAREVEVVLSRVLPENGRSRAYINGRMATAGVLSELGRHLVDLHGQHEHQSLLSTSAQREALDAYAGVDQARRDGARARLRLLEEAIAGAGGTSEVMEREAQLLEYQLAEIDAARLGSADEDERLAVEEEALARASEHRAAAGAAHEALTGDDQICDRLGQVIAFVAGHAPLAPLQERLRVLAVEMADAAEEARRLAESLEDDPQRLAEVTGRRALLRELRRKYGSSPLQAGGRGDARTVPAVGDSGRRLVPGVDGGAAAGSLAAVLEWREAALRRRQELRERASLAERLDAEQASARAELREAAIELGEARREAAGNLAAAVVGELRRLAMPRASFEVRVGPTRAGPAYGPLSADGEGLRHLSGEDVCFLFAANAGEPLLPLSKVASGGELARAMLALRLALLAGGGGSRDVTEPQTLIFDEVDAGIGGQAAAAVGQALADLARRHQVLVVTHLAQVAAFATAQVAVSKAERDGRTVATAAAVSGEERVVELSRMLSGRPASRTARLHAEELLSSAEEQLRSSSVAPAKKPRRT